jgi:hypothetical protein
MVEEAWRVVGPLLDRTDEQINYPRRSWGLAGPAG